jgi:hypothetical protein
VKDQTATPEKRRGTACATLLMLALAILASTIFAALAFAAGAPIITATSVSQVTETSATLKGEINPNEREVKPLYFEYVDQASFEAEGFVGASKTAAETLPKGKEVAKVEAEASGLSPATTYHYRLFAHNALGDGTGPEKTFTTFSPPQSFGPCPNDAFRNERPSGLLPDCRAYEQATPVDKNGGDATNRLSYIAAAEDAVIFLNEGGFPGGDGAQEIPPYLASRRASAWSTQGLLPPVVLGESAKVIGWLPDFSQVYVEATKQGFPTQTAMFARSSADKTLRTIVPYEPGARYFLVGASADGSTVVFETTTKLTEEAIEGKSNVYAWDETSGELSLLGARNDETPPPAGAFGGPFDWAAGISSAALVSGGAATNYYTSDNHAISADGSRAFFTGAGTGDLYMRANPTEPQSELDGEGKCAEVAKACTTQISASQKTEGNGPNGTELGGPRPAAFMSATPDGSKVFFTSSEELTNDANTGPEPTELPPEATISRSNLEGKEIEASFVPARASGIAVDSTYVYWSDTEAGAIGRAKLDKSKAPEPAFITGLTNPQDLAIDSEHVYWVNPTAGTVGRANIVGGGVNQSFISGASAPLGVTVDANYVYWTNTSKAAHSVGRAKLNGEEVNQAFIALNDPALKIPRRLTVDANANRIYVGIDWNGVEGNYILPFTLNGERAYDPVTYKGVLGESQLARNQDFATDANYIYWSIEGEEAFHHHSAIYRVKLDLSGGGPEREFITDPSIQRAQSVAVDGSHVYWANNPPLATKPGNDLYRYDAQTGELIDLTPDAEDPNGAEVRGVLGTSDDGAYVYFVANGDLDGPGGQAEAGDCSGAYRNENSGSCNLYLWHGGSVRFIARLSAGGGGREAWQPTIGYSTCACFGQKSSRVSSDGQMLLFTSGRQLTAYENEGVKEAYRYDAGSDSILCLSCSPSGEAPRVSEVFGEPGGGVSFGTVTTNTLTPNDPAPTLPHVLSANGKRAFFETNEALVGADVDGRKECPGHGGYLQYAVYSTCKDVYEWEAPGEGTCTEASPAFTAQNGGCLYLISSGTERETSLFGGASASGDDVYFFTRAQLVGQDGDLLFDVYDASAGGGLSSQNPPPPPVPCEGEACKGSGGNPPATETPGSSTFAGPPSAKPHRKAKKHHKRKHKRHVKRKAHRNGRASR